MRQKHKWIMPAACLLAILLSACAAQPADPQQTEPPVTAEEPEGLQGPTAITPAGPGREERENRNKQPDAGYLDELEVHCEQYEGMYHLWVETDKESMKALTAEQYKSYVFATGADHGGSLSIGIDGEQQAVYWATFVFPDGTGLCWHGGNWQWGSYGMLDESLRVVQPIYHIGSEQDGADEISITPYESAGTE